MMSKHTKGPWFTVSRYSGGLSVIDQRGFEHIDAKFFAPVFEVCPDKLSFPHWSDSSDSAYLEISDEEQAANALLIAAAPELLGALKEIVDAADGDGWNQLDASFKKARAAIAKATGDVRDFDGEDEGAATTRRAIIRAAAEIGKGMA